MGFLETFLWKYKFEAIPRSIAIKTSTQSYSSCIDFQKIFIAPDYCLNSLLLAIDQIPQTGQQNFQLF